MQSTSCIMGTLVSTVIPLCSIAAAIMGSTAFLEPCMDISPDRRAGPLMWMVDNRAPTFCRLRQQILSTLSICPDLPPCAQIRYFSNRIWLDTLKTMPISIIKNKTDVPP